MGMESDAALRLIDNLASSDALWGGAKTYRRAEAAAPVDEVSLLKAQMEKMKLEM